MFSWPLRMIISAMLALSLGGMACPAQAEQHAAPATCVEGAKMHHDTLPQKHAKLTVCLAVCLADLPDMAPYAGMKAMPPIHFQLPEIEGDGFSVEVATPPPRW